MTDQELLEALEDVARRLGVRVRRESFRGEGGLCTVHGETMIILNKSRTPAEQADLLAVSLGQLDLEELYLAPQVREAIECRRGAAQTDGDSRASDRLAG